jgi:hypothetical protein
MNEYIFTFGFGQNYANGYHAIQAKDSQDARQTMMDKFGTRWAFQYDAPNAREKAGVERFKLKEIT